MTIEQTIDILDVQQEVPGGKTKVAFTPLSDEAEDDPRSHFVKLFPDRKPHLTPQEASDRLCGMCKGSKFTVDALLEERRRDLEQEEEKHRRLFHKE
ncbi:hypothetical protein AGMMS49942_15050 [Spirochaetia bacterium]|nr:hypothetical protein AGMMS49942_15050 [Spirochaetia bacterium]